MTQDNTDLVNATWDLFWATGSLVFATIALVLVTGVMAYHVMKQRKAQERDFERNSAMVFVDFLDKTRADRTALRNFDQMIDGRNNDRKHKAMREHADRVCRAFDTLAFLDRKKLVSSNIFDEFSAATFVDLYTKYLQDYVEYRRHDDLRGPTHYWDLVMLYQRVKNVPDKHPGIRRVNDWPKDARV